MRGLFGKIFFSFWLAGSIVMIASVAAVVFLHPSGHQPSARVFQDASRAYGLAAIAAYEGSGVPASEEYLRDISKNTRSEGCLFNRTGVPLAGERCDKFQSLVKASLSGDARVPSRLDRGSIALALKLDGTNGQTYVFASHIITGPHAPPTYDMKDLLLRGSIAILISGLICYLLALYLTKPIRRLSAVAQRMTAGDLGARVAAPLTLRRDELGEFARDFNEMADRTEGLICGQRQLLYDVSHELRSPLARMNVVVDILRKRVSDDPNVDRLDSDLVLLNEMIGRILTVAKLEATAVVHKPIRIGLADLIASIAHDADFEAQEKGARVEVLIADGSVVYGDHNLIRSSIENVVRNAVRYTDPGTVVEIRLGLLMESSGPLARISVRDYGPGVPSSELRSIFAPFYQVSDRGSRDSKGVGLGLSITERIVKLHGGQIHASNVSPRGLKMEIDLPLFTQTTEMNGPFQEDGDGASVDITEDRLP